MEGLKALRAQLVAQIKTLPPLEQQVLALRYPEADGEAECSLREIGLLLHLPEDRVEQIYWRAMNALKPILDEVRP